MDKEGCLSGNEKEALRQHKSARLEAEAHMRFFFLSSQNVKKKMQKEIETKTHQDCFMSYRLSVVIFHLTTDVSCVVNMFNQHWKHAPVQFSAGDF